MRLSQATLGCLPAYVDQPQYDRNAQAVGIVHFGTGAFHRAHQAVYTDDAMNAGDRGWNIVGVSLRSGDVAQQLNPQDGLYTVTEKSAEGGKPRLIGSVREVLIGPADRARIIATLVAPTTHIVSFTITEKGYCRAPDGSLDRTLAGETSVYGFLAEAFKSRRHDGLPGLTLLSCDNLASNGKQLQRLMSEYLEIHAPDLLDWFVHKCTCPSTMVDRIVPATTDTNLKQIAIDIGLDDAGAVVTEPFHQWVIEDNFAGSRPRWEMGGAVFTDDVEPFETAKLRMLNGAHSALAYLGLQRRHAFVHQAIADPELAPLVNRLMRAEAARSLSPSAGQDLDQYADALMARFANPALNHRLVQIAMDGSQKIPQRWLETLAFNQQRGIACPALLTALAGWIDHFREDRTQVNDPQQQTFFDFWDKVGRDRIVDAFFGPDSPLPRIWQPTDNDRLLLSAKLKNAD